MRKLMLAVAATASLGVLGLSAEAMPFSGNVAPGTKPVANVEKTVVVVTKKVVKPVRRKVCSTTKTARGMVRRCVTR